MTEQFLLKWLAKEDSSAYGECEGRTLNALIDKGLAKVSPVPGKPIQYGRVSLTETGMAAAAAQTES